MWLGKGEGVSPAIQKPDLSGQHDILFNDLYQEVRCAAPSAQVRRETVRNKNLPRKPSSCHIHYGAVLKELTEEIGDRSSAG